MHGVAPFAGHGDCAHCKIGRSIRARIIQRIVESDNGTQHVSFATRIRQPLPFGNLLTLNHSDDGGMKRRAESKFASDGIECIGVTFTW
jgi:hypothetical protein